MASSSAKRRLHRGSLALDGLGRFFLPAAKEGKLEEESWSPSDSFFKAPEGVVVLMREQHAKKNGRRPYSYAGSPSKKPGREKKTKAKRCCYFCRA